MTISGPLFYDQSESFANYLQRRQQSTSANETIELPIFLSLLGDVTAKDILDLGCGEATLAHFLFEQGCHSYTGIDGSENMVNLAQKNLAQTPAQIQRDYIEFWDYAPAQVDLVISRLAFHYLEDIERVFAGVYQTLRPGGRLIFSVEHPVITSHQVSGGKPRQDWLVDRYFQTGQRQVNWLGSEVFKYHRTVEDYYLGLQKVGFQITHLRESRPDPQNFSDPKLFERRSRVPLYLFLAANKEIEAN